MNKKLIGFLIGFFTPALAMAALSESDKALLFGGLLPNGGGEMSTTGWTASGGTLTTDKTVKLEGNASISWDSSSASQTLTYTVPVGALKQKNGVLQVSFLCASGTCTHTVEPTDGTNPLATPVTIPSDTSIWKSVTINFPVPSSGNVGLRITSVASNEPKLYIDKARIVDANEVNLKDVSQATLVGGVVITGCANPWNSTSTSYASFGTQTGCIYTTFGAAQAPSSNIPAFKFASLPPGEYRIEFEGGLGTTTFGKAVWFQFTDGTSTAREVGEAWAGNGVFLTNVTQTIQYLTAKSNVTFELKAKAESGAQARVHGIDATPATIRLYRYPTSSELAYRPELRNWRVDANIGGANPSIGTSAVTSYTEITNGSLDLVQNPGSIPVKIACASGTASTGTTCSGANESVGVTFDVPLSGKAEACFYYGIWASGAMAATFQVVETTDTSSTILSEGNSRATFSPTGSMDLPAETCGVFNFNSAGPKTVRLMREQIAGADSGIRADRSATLGARDIHVTVRPIDQSIPNPLLMGSVTSDYSGQLKLETAAVETTCSGSPCTITRQTDWLSSITRSGTGLYTFNFSPSFATPPHCSLTSDWAPGYYSTMPTTSSVAFQVTDSGGTPRDSKFTIQCFGPRQ